MAIEHNNTVLKRSDSLYSCAKGFADLVNKPAELKFAAACLSFMVRKFSAVVEANNPEFVQLSYVLDFLGAQIQSQTNLSVEHQPALRTQYLESAAEETAQALKEAAGKIY
jgi:hypothetical protein